jgi:hypothetical protein
MQRLLRPLTPRLWILGMVFQQTCTNSRRRFIDARRRSADERPPLWRTPCFKWTHGEKAADCERALRLVIDPVHRERLVNIRGFWISLANERSRLSEDEFAKEAEAISRFMRS